MLPILYLYTIKQQQLNHFKFNIMLFNITITNAKDIQAIQSFEFEYSMASNEYDDIEYFQKQVVSRYNMMHPHLKLIFAQILIQDAARYENLGERDF